MKKTLLFAGLVSVFSIFTCHADDAFKVLKLDDVQYEKNDSGLRNIREKGSDKLFTGFLNLGSENASVVVFGEEQVRLSSRDNNKEVYLHLMKDGKSQELMKEWKNGKIVK